jgi:hypothetical protein
MTKIVKDDKTEEAGLAALAKAENATKPAAKRDGDDTNAESAPKVEGKATPKHEAVEVEAGFEDDLNALVGSEETLSEGFKEKASVIFEAAIKTQVAEEVDRLEKEYQAQLEEEVSKIDADLLEGVESYLNYVVEGWMKENEVALQATWKSEITESFMSNLKAVFVEHNVEVPESKVDLVEELATAAEEAEAAADAAHAESIEIAERKDAEIAGLHEQLLVAHCAAALTEVSESLTATQTEKLAALAESIEYSSIEEFTNKVSILKESHFASNAAPITEETDNSQEAVATDPYTAAFALLANAKS